MQFHQKYKLPNGKNLEVRCATVSDSKATAGIWNSVVREKVYTMGLNFISENDEGGFIKNLDERETILVSSLDRKIVGYLILTIPEKICKSTLHVAEIGTFVLERYRGLGIGHFLLLSGFKFARDNNFEKMVIKVRSSNKGAIDFYRTHGFEQVGIFRKHIKMEGKYDDHVLMEKFLREK